MGELITCAEVNAGMTKLSVAFRTDVHDNDVALVFDVVSQRKWSAWSFYAAVDACILELDWMPKIKQILERYVPEPKEAAEQVLIAGPTAEDNEEIDRMIAKITNPTLRGICEKFVGGYETDANRYEERLRCHHCHDSGALEVYDPRNNRGRDAKRGTLTASQVSTVMVACGCDTGRQKNAERDPSEKNRCKPLTGYDSKQMCLVKETTKEGQRAEFVAFMSGWEPKGYYSEFSEFDNRF